MLCFRSLLLMCLSGNKRHMCIKYFVLNQKRILSFEDDMESQMKTIAASIGKKSQSQVQERR